MAKGTYDTPVREVPAKNTGAGEAAGANNVGQYYCALQEQPARVFAPGVTGERQQAIIVMDDKWTNGTVLRYYFFDRDTDGQTVQFTDGTTAWRSWIGAEAQQAVVRRGFQAWTDVGIGVEFREVDVREEAEIRIGFEQGDGAWSYLGRAILNHAINERTMNFGWDLTRGNGLDTAIHEIGHTLGFPHEHQNPNSGIVWDEAAVYAELAKPPNGWDQQKAFWNIIRKLPVDTVKGTTWDPDSVMHYPFSRGLIKKPERYANGLQPAGGLSGRDKSWVRFVYPPEPAAEAQELLPAVSAPLQLEAGQQRNFIVAPQETRYYQFQTFGASDLVMVLFEDDNGEYRYRTASDDSGEDSNANFRIKLVRGRRYMLRVRLYYSERPGATSVMMW